eukprot:m.1323554 g.1323554  ORF g.1323554 m.1323554 type:complete len:103 (+) comp24851_c0_seq7:4496-4804(+)
MGGFGPAGRGGPGDVTPPAFVSVSAVVVPAGTRAGFAPSGNAGPGLVMLVGRAFVELAVGEPPNESGRGAVRRGGCIAPSALSASDRLLPPALSRLALHTTR